MSPHIRLLCEMLAALAVAGIFLRELHSRPLIDSTRTWPLLVLLLIIVVAGIQVGVALWRLSRTRAQEENASLPQEEWRYPGRRYALMTAFATYVLALPHLGYAVASALFVPVGGAILAMPLTARNLALGMAMAVGAYLLFVVAFEVPMPDGLLPPPRRWL